MFQNKSKIKKHNGPSSALFHSKPGGELVFAAQFDLYMCVCANLPEGRAEHHLGLCLTTGLYVNARVSVCVCAWVWVPKCNRGPQKERPWAPHAWLPASQLSLVHNKRILCFYFPPCELSRPWGHQKRHVRTSEGRDTFVCNLTHLIYKSMKFWIIKINRNTFINDAWSCEKKISTIV